MSSSVLYMSMSLDGFITGPDDDAGVLDVHLIPVLPGAGRTGGAQPAQS